MLSQQDRLEYDEMLNTIQTDGFQYILKRFKEAYTIQNDMMSIPDERTLYLAQGRLLTLSQFINIEDLIKQELVQLELDSEDDGTNELES